MRSRTEAREKAIQVIYSIFSTRDEDSNIKELIPTLKDRIKQVEKFQDKGMTASQTEFIEYLLTETINNLDEIDTLIKKYVQNWDFHRISLIDKSVLRIAIMELVYSDTPNKVVINEAIELAVNFSGVKSSKFINGILDAIMHKETKE